MSTSGQVIDTDLAPANIKSGVNIFGVAGSFGGWFWSTAIGRTQYWVGSDSKILPQYVFELYYMNTLVSGRNCFVDYGNYITIGIWRDNYSPQAPYTSFYRINKTTGVCIAIGSATGAYGSFSSIYYESGHIYWNKNDGTMYDVNITTWTMSWVAGNHTTGIVPSTTSLVYNGLTFTIPALISTDIGSGGYTLRRGNSMSSAFNRMWILIS